MLTGAHVSDAGSYRQPVLRRAPLIPVPPQMIITLPVHTAVWYSRASGKFFHVGLSQVSSGTQLDEVLTSVEVGSRAELSGTVHPGSGFRAGTGRGSSGTATAGAFSTPNRGATSIH